MYGVTPMNSEGYQLDHTVTQKKGGRAVQQLQKILLLVDGALLFKTEFQGFSKGEAREALVLGAASGGSPLQLPQ